MDPLPLPAGIRSRYVEGINGLRMHVLEAGDPKAPGLLLLHGFPELAFSWRHVMPALAESGYHVIAPDQRGFGRTTGWDPGYDGDLAPFLGPHLARDAIALVHALGHETVDLAGHDFGSLLGGLCALLHPEVFRSVALMSAPFGGPHGATSLDKVLADLAALPRPRKHYQAYYCTRDANRDMMECAQGLHAFLRAYFHVKSADWKQNRPHPLAAWSAAELAKMPTYYIMDLHEDMAQTVAHEMPSPGEIAACRWMTEKEMAVYAAEFGRTGFQGGLQWYRAQWSPEFARLMQALAGRTIDVPACFISGKSDWGNYQSPGNLDRMATRACTQYRGTHLLEGAGHWVQQEQPEAVVRLLREFLASAR
ncbi:MAG TPA: alpha/beta hydrolase [Burkholderiales bacterium]|nr:alpha/beta hydrolase [Burkholderiales bacterium]